MPFQLQDGQELKNRIRMDSGFHGVEAYSQVPRDAFIAPRGQWNTTATNGFFSAIKPDSQQRKQLVGVYRFRNIV